MQCLGTKRSKNKFVFINKLNDALESKLSLKCFFSSNFHVVFSTNRRAMLEEHVTLSVVT